MSPPHNLFAHPEGRVYYCTNEQDHTLDVFDTRSLRLVEQLPLTDNPNKGAVNKLVKPLAPQAGGEGHTGGTFWESTDDPEYQALLDWVRRLPPDRFTPPAAPATLVHSSVEPEVTCPREGRSLSLHF